MLPQVNTLSESNNPQSMGLECSDIGGGRHCHGGETYRLGICSLQAPARSDPSLSGETQEKRNQMGARAEVQHSPGHQPCCPHRVIASQPGRAMCLSLGLLDPSHLSKTARETAVSPSLAEAVARQDANSCPHLEQLVSPCISTLVTYNNV